MIKFQNRLQSGGVLFINSSLVEAEASRGDITVVNVPASSVAEDMGSPKSANMVLLGAFIKKSNLASLSSVIQGLKGTMGKKQKQMAVNEKALQAGYDLF
jgi:2-oxoglutarate ferredoxin oxidoreductase subunit gamma